MKAEVVIKGFKGKDQYMVEIDGREVALVSNIPDARYIVRCINEANMTYEERRAYRERYSRETCQPVFIPDAYNYIYHLEGIVVEAEKLLDEIDQERHFGISAGLIMRAEKIKNMLSRP